MKILAVAFRKANRRHAFNIALFCVFLFFFQVFATYAFIRYTRISQVHATLERLSSRIQSDFSFVNGKIDTHRYAADPDTPFPRGSSGFPHSLYIITNDGFVIERNLPIRGLLSTSDFKHLALFSVPTTISPSTNESWRIFSLPVLHDGTVAAVVAVSYYAPDEKLIPDIDAKLTSAARTLQSGLYFSSAGTLSTDRIDIRSISYDIAFEIVTISNAVVANNGRTPSYIDPSYVVSTLQLPRFSSFRDAQSGTEYTLRTSPLLDAEGKTKGVIVLGESMASINDFMTAYILYSIIVGFVLSAPIAWFTVRLIKKDAQSIIDSYHEAREAYTPETIFFDQKKSLLHIDGEILELPYASNQYVLLRALFSKPHKRWELDALLELLGEHPSKDGWRIIYDAMLAINKKSGIKLVTFRSKTLFLNPTYRSAINTSLHE